MTLSELQKLSLEQLEARSDSELQNHCAELFPSVRTPVKIEARKATLAELKESNSQKMADLAKRLSALKL
jgi:hypothetical protein